MKSTRFVFLCALWLCGVGSANALQKQSGSPEQLQATIDAQTTSPPISKYLYGQFIEHIRNTMYNSLWAEMLDDRKFYFPITAAVNVRGR